MFYTEQGCASLRALGYKFCQGGYKAFLYKQAVGLVWFIGGLGSVRFTVGLDDLKGLFQPKRFYDSVIVFVQV